MLHGQQRIGSVFELLPVDANDDFGVEFVGFLAEFLQEAAGLFGDVDAFDAPVDRIRLAYHEAGGLQAIDQRPHRNLADIEFVGKLGLGQTVLARDECEHPPLRAGNPERRQVAIEHHPPEPRHVVDEISKPEIPIGLINHRCFP